MKEKRLESVRRWLVSIFLGGNIMSILLLLLCCGSTWVNPAEHGHLSALGLAFPLVLIFNLLFIPFWLIFKPKLVCVPLAGVLLCSGFVLDYFPIHSASESSDSGIVVLSWNVRSFAPSLSDSDEQRVLQFFEEKNADIVCLQECYGGHTVRHLNEQMSAKGYVRIEGKGRVIYTKFPIVASDTLACVSMISNGVARYWLDMGGDTLVVYNVHLECNYISPNDKAESKNAIKSAEGAKLGKEGRHIWGKLAEAARYRGPQVDTLTSSLDQLPEGTSVIVCGDFNDTPISYAYQSVARRLKNAYREAGFGIGISFNERLFPIRIDHLFCSSDWKASSAEIDRSMLTSDHFPLVVRLEKH